MKLIFSSITLLLVIVSCKQVSSNQQQNQPIATHSSPPFPKKPNFAGEPMPIHTNQAKEALDLELIKNTYWHSNTMLLIKRKAKYFKWIEQEIKQQNLPEDLKYLAVAESNLDPTIVSPAGAKGIWQFMPGTAKDFGLRVDDEVDERSDIQKSTKAALRYLKILKDSTNSWALAAASYNAGWGNIKKALQQQGNNSKQSYYDLNLFKETERYIYRIVALKAILSDPQQYGFQIKPSQLYLQADCDTLMVKNNIENWHDWATQNNTTYKELTYYNPWIVGSKLTIANGKTYKVSLPKARLTN